MLQTRPSSSEAFQSASQSQQHQRNSPMPRNIYNTSVGGMATGNYRGHTSISPVAPYAFTTAPILPSSANPLRQHPTAPHLRYENRTASAPVVPFTQQTSLLTATSPSLQRLPAINTVSSAMNLVDTFPSQQQIGSKDDTSLPVPSAKQDKPRPLSSIELNSPSLATTLPSANPAKPGPDRYRRNNRRAESPVLPATSSSTQGGSALPSGSGMATVGHLYNIPTQTSSTPTLSSYQMYARSRSPLSSQDGSDVSTTTQSRLSSSDDMTLPKQSVTEQATRYRRRSITSLDTKDHAAQSYDPPVQAAKPKSYAATLASPAPQERKEARGASILKRPESSHGRNASTESTSTGRSSSRATSVCYESCLPPSHSTDENVCYFRW